MHAEDGPSPSMLPSGEFLPLPFQVFISYAHNDDLPALDNGAPESGFVSTLWARLEYHFKRLGPPAPFIWRDDKGIKPSDDFDPVIQGGIEQSDILLVILSNNWLSRPWCQKELDLFSNAWEKRDAGTLRQRVIPVLKSALPFDQWPPLLQGKQGYVFFDEDESGPRWQREFFDYTCGKPVEEYKRQYDAQIERLAVDLRERAAQRNAPAQPTTGPASNGRCIYVAQPAGDMRDAYDRVVKELQQRGFSVIPDPGTKIPLDEAKVASGFVDEGLKQAEASIHLLGQNLGQTPDGDGAEPIAKLQLNRAAVRAQSDGANGKGFCRFIWAPKFMVSVKADDQKEEERDPFKVLEKFGQPMPGDQDKVEDCECSDFIDVVLGYLERMKPAQQLGDLSSDAKVYLHCREDDVQYALQVGKALLQRKIEPIKPIFKGDPTEVVALNKKRMAACDAIVLCWGNAPEAWVTQQPGIWRDYRSLGRDKDFSRRGLLAGPPSDDPDKEYSVGMQQYDGVDLVLDLRQYNEGPLPPEALDPLFS